MIFKNTYTILSSFLLISLFMVTSCSRKAAPEISHNRQNKNSTYSPAKHTPAKSSDAQPTASKKSTSVPKTNNSQLQHFLNQGCQRTLQLGHVSPDDIIKSARKYMGTRHRMGGTTKSGIDCSGLIMAALAENGIKISHNSEDQARYGEVILDKNKLKKGDFVFFINTYKTSKYITHVGIYIGNNQMIHTSSSKGVSITSLDNSYWKDKYIFGTRIF